MKVGDRVRIGPDPDGLTGQEGTVGKFSDDGTTAWVDLPPLQLGEGYALPNWGAWCSVNNLEKIEEGQA